jgi:hypothetical protein
MTENYFEAAVASDFYHCHPTEGKYDFFYRITSSPTQARRCVYYQMAEKEKS